nr:PREDICTED: uncharacterized protein LOC104145339 [Struthio camelus australis]
MGPLPHYPTVSFHFQSLSLLAPFCLRHRPLHLSGTTRSSVVAPMAESFEHLMRDVTAGRCVGIAITNNLEHVTLRNPRSYCFSGHSHPPPPVQIPTGTVGKCVFVKRSYSLRGSVGVLVYEADTFCLAIMFSNPFDYNLYYIEFGLKLIPKDRQFQSVEDLFRDMMESSPLQEVTTFQKMKLSYSQGPLQVTMDNVRVTATMSNASKAVLTVLLEENSPKGL